MTGKGQHAAPLRERLVSELRDLGLRDARVAGAFEAVAREAFVADIAASQGLEAVYRNEALPAKTDAHGRWLSSSSQPTIMALMLEQLELEPGQRVLEIGAGTGYNAALLSHIVGAAGHVTTLEIDADLATRARQALRAGGYPAEVVLGDGRERGVIDGPYDRIIVTASTEVIPNAWLEQLRPGGRLELPLRLDPDAVPQAITAFELHDGRLESVAMTWGGFVPLHGADDGYQPPSTDLHATFASNGRPASLLRVTGAGLQRLSDPGRRRLLASLLGEPSSRRPGSWLTRTGPGPPDLLLYLVLRSPRADRVVVHTPTREAIGFVSGDGGDVAVVSFPVDHPGQGDSPRRTRQRPGRRQWWLETYGDASSSPEPDNLLAKWRQLERRRQTQLQIVARPSSTGANAGIDFRWTASS